MFLPLPSLLLTSLSPVMFFSKKNSCVVEYKNLKQHFESHSTKHGADCYGCHGGDGGGRLTITPVVLV
jgi:hypothetical protein